MPILNSNLRGETLLEQPCIELYIYSRRKQDQGMENQPPTTHQPSHPSVCTLEETCIPTHKYLPSVIPAAKSFSFDNSSAENTSSDTVNVPIAIRKGTRVCTKHPIATHASYHRLSTTMRAFTANLSSVEIPKDIQEALAIPEWKQVVLEEMRALENNEMWQRVDAPRGKKPVGCKWVLL